MVLSEGCYEKGIFMLFRTYYVIFREMIMKVAFKIHVIFTVCLFGSHCSAAEKSAYPSETVLIDSIALAT